MPRVLYCRHTNCRQAYTYSSTATALPPICPACGLVAHWSTKPVVDVIDLHDPYAWTLTRNDRRFLKSLHIEAD